MSNSSILRSQLNSKKSRSSDTKKGAPSLNDLREGVPQFRKTHEGLVEYVRIGSVIYKSVFEAARKNFKEKTKDSLKRMPDFDSGWIHIDKENSGGGNAPGYGAIRIPTNTFSKNQMRFDKPAKTWSVVNAGGWSGGSRNEVWTANTEAIDGMDLPCPIQSSNWFYTRHADTAGNVNKAIFPMRESYLTGVFDWCLKRESTTGDIFLCYQCGDNGSASVWEILGTYLDGEPANDGYANNYKDHSANGTVKHYDEVDVRFQLWF